MKLEKNAAAVFLYGLVALTVQSAAAQDWKPSRNVDIAISSGAGGAADRQGRQLQKLLLQAVPGIPSITVTNKPGGAGLVAWTGLAQHAGDAHFIATLSTGLLTNQVLGVGQLRYQDLTPLNILMREYVVAWVKADSPFASIKDVVARLKKDPASVSFAFAAARGNQNHIVIGMIARAAGIDPKAAKTVVFSSGGQGMTAALGGHVDVWVGTPGGAIQHMQSGAARALGISATQRQSARLAAVPTFREQGVEASYFAWRGFVAAGGLTTAQTAFWDQAFARVVRSDEWKRDLDDNGWAEDFKASAETRKHLDAEYEMLARMLADLGMVGKQ
ncbi:MAG TPA: tripartite tricarboxylate transporter substrate binding protein [Burkholderiales bacterium]|nr:tripartite tricarboxylate transporter substrate binding protein [Burkholderiales bacterium]